MHYIDKRATCSSLSTSKALESKNKMDLPFSGLGDIFIFFFYRIIDRFFNDKTEP